MVQRSMATFWGMMVVKMFVFLKHPSSGADIPVIFSFVFGSCLVEISHGLLDFNEISINTVDTRRKEIPEYPFKAKQHQGGSADVT